MIELIRSTNFNILQTIVNLAGNINKEAFTFSDIERDFSIYVTYRANLGSLKIKSLEGAMIHILGRETSDMYEFIGIIFACQEAVEVKNHLASLRAETLTPPILTSYKPTQSTILPRRLDFDLVDPPVTQAAPSRKRKSLVPG